MHDFFEDHTHLSELDPDAVLEEIEGVEKSSS